MATDRRAQFVKKWRRRAEKTADPFDRFFSAWIALVVAAQRSRDCFGPLAEDDTDRKRVEDYSSAKKTAILSAVGAHKVEMEWIAERRGMRYGDALVDTGNRDLRSTFSRLSRYYTEDEPMPEDERVEAIAQLLNKIRNNVFHGIKVYDDKDDIALLEKVNPVLLAILRETEESETEAG